MLPPQLEEGREELARFFDACRNISDMLLRAFAVGLGVGYLPSRYGMAVSDENSCHPTTSLGRTPESVVA